LACLRSGGPSAGEQTSRRLRRPLLGRIELALSPQPSFTAARCPTFYEKPLLVKLNLRRKRLTRRGFGGGAPKSLPEAAWLHGWRIDHSSIRALPLQSGMPMWVFRYGFRAGCPISRRASQPMVGPSSPTRITIDLPNVVLQTASLRRLASTSLVHFSAAPSGATNPIGFFIT